MEEEVVRTKRQQGKSKNDIKDPLEQWPWGREARGEHSAKILCKRSRGPK